MDIDLHRTSYDLKKAFDSVSKSLMLLAWQRIGVPSEVAYWLTAMDIGGTTVVKTPYAQYMWDILKYQSVRTEADHRGQHPTRILRCSARNGPRGRHITHVLDRSHGHTPLCSPETRQLQSRSDILSCGRRRHVQVRGNVICR